LFHIVLSANFTGTVKYKLGKTQVHILTLYSPTVF